MKTIKPAVIIIAIFLIMFFTLRACEANEGTVELGATYTSDFNDGYALIYTERTASGKWDIGTVLVSEQEWNGNHAGRNGGVFAQRIVKWKRLELGLGAGYWVQTSLLIGCHFTWALSTRLNITKRIPLTFRHWSNAGTCTHNRGQDILTIGWRF